jgi:hypothetical protein
MHLRVNLVKRVEHIYKLPFRMGQSTINQKKIHRDGVNYRVQQVDRSDVDADALEENNSVLGRVR